MAQLILGGIGAAVGSSVAGGAGAKWGWMIGSTLGGLLWPPKQRAQSRGKLADLTVPGSQYGAGIPIVYGSDRLAGNLIWLKRDSSGNHLVEHVRKKKAGGKGGGGGEFKDYYYTYTGLWLVSKTGNSGVRRIWTSEGELVYDVANPTKYQSMFQVLPGNSAQAVPSVISTQEGTLAPAYRGRLTVLVTDFPTKYGSVSGDSLWFEVTETYPETILSYDPEIYYRGEDTPGLLQDSSGNARHLSQTPDVTSQVTGRIGDALFPGNGNPVLSTVGDVPAMYGAQGTVIAWCKWNGASATAIDDLRYMLPASGDYPWKLEVDWLSEQLTYRISVLSGGTVERVSAGGALPRDGAWHQVACSWNQAGQTRLYIDREKVAEGAMSSFAASSLAFGADGTARVQITAGSLGRTHWDEVSMVPTQLPDDVIFELYDMGLGGF
jgi:hypothetical protein